MREVYPVRRPPIPRAGRGYGRAVIFHIAEVADWAAARAAGSYRISTRGRTLDVEGFIHAARREQILDVAERWYADAGPLLVLSIDPDRLSSPVREEEVAPGVTYPHVYGPIDLSAVVGVAPLERGPGGDFVLPAAASGV